MIRAVIDTNVFVSGTLGLNRADSTLGEILRRWHQGSFLLATSDPIICEVRRTLNEPYFSERISELDRVLTLDALITYGQHAALPSEVEVAATHAEDDHVLRLLCLAELMSLLPVTGSCSNWIDSLCATKMECASN